MAESVAEDGTIAEKLKAMAREAKAEQRRIEELKTSIRNEVKGEIGQIYHAHFAKKLEDAARKGHMSCCLEIPLDLCSQVVDGPEFEDVRENAIVEFLTLYLVGQGLIVKAGKGRGEDLEVHWEAD